MVILVLIGILLSSDDGYWIGLHDRSVETGEFLFSFIFSLLFFFKFVFQIYQYVSGMLRIFRLTRC